MRTGGDHDHPDGRCELCARSVSRLDKHHLIPRTRHKNKKNKRLFERDDVRSRLAWLCRPCHKQIHVLFREKELELEFNETAKLARHPEVARFVEWVAKRPDGTSIRSFGSKDRRRHGRWL